MRVKICGITRPADAVLAEQAGADAIGLIFAEGSRRYVTVETARQVVDAAGPLLLRVGVFRNAPLERVLDTAAELRLQLVQLHGDEDHAFVAEAARSVAVIKALPFGAGLRPADFRSWPADGILLDAVTPGAGIPFDWEQAGALAGQPRLILAGGLNPGNVAEAVRLLRPYGVDVASGVESAPGIKDAGLVHSFIREARRSGGQAGGQEP
jgi:phosphoribosylanthranilate isomerase